MKKSLFILILSLAFSFQLYSQNIQQQIMFNLFNANIAEANDLIEQHIQKNPEHPKFYFLKAHHNFYMRYFDNRQHDRDSVIQVIVDNAQQAIKWGEKYKMTTELKFYVGASYGFLSRAYAMRGDYWDSYWAAKECINYLEEVLEEDPQYYDAYLALGVIEYFPTRLTGFTLFMATISGMSGDLDTAYDYFRKTAENGDLLKDEATFILASLYRIFESDFPTAEMYYTKLREKFPNNNTIEAQYLQIKLAQLIENQGVEHFKENLETYREEYMINSSAQLNNLGYSFRNQQKHELAEGVFLLNIKLYPDEANPYDSISEFYETIGDNNQAFKYATIGLQILPHDSTANDDTKELLRGLMETRIDDLSSSAL